MVKIILVTPKYKNILVLLNFHFFILLYKHWNFLYCFLTSYCSISSLLNFWYNFAFSLYFPSIVIKIGMYSCLLFSFLKDCIYNFAIVKVVAFNFFVYFFYRVCRLVHGFFSVLLSVLIHDFFYILLPI